jgi:steroid delta-isomerase-like uncharacterized protein
VSEENKALVRRYFETVDETKGDWDVLDQFLAEDFVTHSPFPGHSPDREGMKQQSKMFEQATPGDHVIKDQVAEGDKVVTYVLGRGRHAGELMGIPATGRDVEVEGIAIHRIADGKIVEHWAVSDLASLLQQIGALPAPQP